MATQAIKKYKCPLAGCDKRYAKPCLLREHTRSHNNDRPYVCPEPECGKRFIRVCHLNVHKWSHSKVKPLACTECHKGFTTKQQLSRHLQTHKMPENNMEFTTNLQPYNCSPNSHRSVKSFEENKILKIKCTYDLCEKVFFTGWDLTEHLLDEHLTSKIAPECGEIQLPLCMEEAGLEPNQPEIETFFRSCEEIFLKDYDYEADSWRDLKCKKCECFGWSAPSYTALIEHYEDRHMEIPVSLLQMCFRSESNF